MYIINYLGKLTVPNLGGSLEPKTGFQLFLTERGGAISSEIFKIARVGARNSLIRFPLKVFISFYHI